MLFELSQISYEKLDEIVDEVDNGWEKDSEYISNGCLLQINWIVDMTKDLSQVVLHLTLDIIFVEKALYWYKIHWIVDIEMTISNVSDVGCVFNVAVICSR